MNTTTNTRGVDAGMLRNVFGSIVKSMRATARAWGPTRNAQVIETWADEIETTLEAALPPEPAIHGQAGIDHRALPGLLAPEPAAQGEGEAVADECRHDWVDYVQAEYKPRHRVLELGESNIERYVRIGLMCTICGAEKPAPPAPEPAERVPEEAFEEDGKWWVRMTDELDRVLGRALRSVMEQCVPYRVVLVQDEVLVERLPDSPAAPDRPGITGANTRGVSEAVLADALRTFRAPPAPPAPPAERVPEGWKLVPVEATDDMLKAAYPLHWWDGPGQRLKQNYRKLVDASPAPSEGGKGVDGASLIAAERKRQKAAEGWTHAHDLQYERDELVRAAICYASRHAKDVHCPTTLWPWDQVWWKPRNRRDDLVRAGALIAAELDRLEIATGAAR